MDNKKVKMGVIGLGRGQDVIKLMADEDNMTVRAICDKNTEKLEAARKFYVEEKGVKDLLCFEIAEDLIASDIDAVYIATDAICHVPYVKLAMEASKHVISEIPAVNSVEEAKELKAVVKAHPKLKYMCGENCCYWAFIEAWKGMREDGKLGDVVYAEAEYLHSVSPDKFKPIPPEHWRAHNPAIHYITHELGPLLYIMDDKCVSVSCVEPDIRYNPYKQGPETGVALFRTANGAAIRILICFGAFVSFDHNYSVFGTRGMLETDKTKPLDSKHTFARLNEIPETVSKKLEIPVTTSFANGDAPKEGHGGADKNMMKAFVKCILEDTAPPIDVDLAIRMTIPGLIAHKSAEMGGATLEIPEID